MPIKKYQKELDASFRKLKWSYWPPLVILARLTEEVGEFARLVNHRFGMKKKKVGEAEQDMEEELGDIIYTLICFANQNGLDLDRAFRKSFNKVMARDKHRFSKEKK
jgi:NTP pyrophosphatase (non-canonical NTP hydrolase)